MEAYYLESSALAKRYVAETGTAWVQAICDPSAKNVLHAVRIAEAEVVAALYRRVREGTVAAADAAAAATRLRDDTDQQYQVVEVSSALIQRAVALIEKHGLRGYDGVQLAAACQVQDVRVAAGVPPLVVVSADKALTSAATAEGILVEDPNLHP